MIYVFTHLKKYILADQEKNNPYNHPLHVQYIHIFQAEVYNSWQTNESTLYSIKISIKTRQQSNTTCHFGLQQINKTEID